jgi:hypothetical protein
LDERGAEMGLRRPRRPQAQQQRRGRRRSARQGPPQAELWPPAEFNPQAQKPASPAAAATATAVRTAAAVGPRPNAAARGRGRDRSRRQRKQGAVVGFGARCVVHPALGCAVVAAGRPSGVIRRGVKGSVSGAYGATIGTLVYGISRSVKKRSAQELSRDRKLLKCTRTRTKKMSVTAAHLPDGVPIKNSEKLS